MVWVYLLGGMWIGAWLGLITSAFMFNAPVEKPTSRYLYVVPKRKEQAQ